MRRFLIVSVLAVALLPSPWAAAATRQATPRPEGVTVDQIIEATLDWHTLPRAIDTLALVRATLPAGATAAALNGAHLVLVESGALTVQEFARAYVPPAGTPGPVHENVPAGPPVTHGAGDQFLVVDDGVSPPAITNAGTEPAIALVVSIAFTGGNRIGESLTGWTVVEPLAVADATGVGPPLFAAGRLDTAPISVALDRASYERATSLDFIWVESAARLFAVETGALNVLVIDPALYMPAVASPKQLPATSRVSLTRGDQLLVPAPGRIATRNVARGPSVVLIVTVGSAPETTVEG
ncbi:MAG: hypothetical protein ACRDJW_13175 [Thermomicrobiales bacterium]